MQFRIIYTYTHSQFNSSTFCVLVCVYVCWLKIIIYVFLLPIFFVGKECENAVQNKSKKKKDRIMNMILCSINVGVCLVMRSVFMPSEHLGTIYGLFFL